jgi:hypothetical protein
MQKTLKSYVLTAYIAPHRNPHMRPHVAYAICNASPHAYSNPHFKTLDERVLGAVLRGDRNVLPHPHMSRIVD